VFGLIGDTVDLLPASGINTNGDEVLVQEETDVGGNVLHEQTVGTNVERKQLEWVCNVERDPAYGLAQLVALLRSL